MAQSGFTPILLYASNTATSLPSAGNLTNSANGAEVAVNTADKRLFTKDSGGSVVELGTNPSALTVAGTTTLSGLTASTALALNASKEVVSVTNTGTGNNVLSASPTLTGTVGMAAATLSGNLTLSGGTANGVLYLDGSKVATSGSSLTFDGTKLSLPTVLAIKGAQNSNIAKIAMTRTDASYSINNETDLRFYGQTTDTESPANILHSMSTGGTFVWNNGSGSEQMRLTSTGLGIGTSSPATKLHVNTGVAGYGITVAAFSQTSRTYQFGIDSNSNFAIYESVAAAQRLILDQFGNLGLGVTPSAWANSKAFDIGGFGSLSTDTLNDANTSLSWNSYATAYNAWKYKNTGSAASRYTQEAGKHYWYTAPSGTAGNAISFTQAMTLDANNQLLLGTTSTTQITGFSGGSIGVTVQSGLPTIALVDSDDTTNYISWLANSGGTLYLYNKHSTSPLIFGTNNTERARITSGGNLKIGGSADRATTEGDKQLVLFDGTAPVGTLANGISLYSSSGEAYVMDAAGNATLFSPHDAQTNEWIFRSKHTPTGKVLKIDVERLLKFVNDHFGLDAVHEFIEN